MAFWPSAGNKNVFGNASHGAMRCTVDELWSEMQFVAKSAFCRLILHPSQVAPRSISRYIGRPEFQNGDCTKFRFRPQSSANFPSLSAWTDPPLCMQLLTPRRRHSPTFFAGRLAKRWPARASTAWKPNVSRLGSKGRGVEQKTRNNRGRREGGKEESKTDRTGRDEI